MYLLIFLFFGGDGCTSIMCFLPQHLQFSVSFEPVVTMIIVSDLKLFNFGWVSIKLKAVDILYIRSGSKAIRGGGVETH